MAIKRYTANADTTITNAYEQNFRTRGTGSNMGASDVTEIFSIYGQAYSASAEVSRALYKFPVDDVITDRNNEDIPDSGSVKFYLRLFNAKHAFTVPRSAVYTVAAVSQSWDEGVGLDMEGYTDLTLEKEGCDWLYASKSTKWISAAAATITITDLTEINDDDKVNLVATDGTSHDFTAGSVAGGGTWIAETNNNTTATNLAAQINANAKFSASASGAVVTVTQATAGSAGNTTVTLTDSGTAGMSKTNFTGGTDDIGGSYHDSPRFDVTGSNGNEDLEVDITHLVEQWIGGENNTDNITAVRKRNYGVGVSLTGSQEAYSGETKVDKVLQNLTGSQLSYYTKKFFARGSQYWFKRPCIEARWDSSVKDNASNFNYYSQLLPICENINTIYFYNFVDGQLKTIPGLDTPNVINIELYSASLGDAYAKIPHGESAGEKLTLKSASCKNWVRDGGTANRGIPVANNTATKATGGQTTTKGIYSCSVAITGSDNASELTKLWAVWYGTISSARYEFYTASITPRILKPYSNNDQIRYVTSCPSLRHAYHKDENTRFRFFIREKNWSPNIYAQASSEPQTKIIEDAYYRVYRVADILPVIDYGTGSTNNNYSRLSYDISGNYFDLDISMLQPDYAYGIKLVYYLNGAYIEQPEAFKFRVEES